MKETTVPIDRAGRIVLPKAVREELAIEPGDTLRVSVQGLTVTLTPSQEVTGLVRKGKALLFSTTKDEILSQETVDHILEQGRDERYRDTIAGIAGRKRKE